MLMAATGEADPTGALPDSSAGPATAPPVDLPALQWNTAAPEGEPAAEEVDIVVLHGGDKGVVRCPTESSFLSLKMGIQEATVITIYGHYYHIWTYNPRFSSMGIQEATGLPCSHQRLIFDKKQRKDTESFAEARLAHQGKVRLLYSDQFALTREGKAELTEVEDEVSQLEESIPKAVKHAEQRLIDYGSFMIQLAGYEDTFKRLKRDLQMAYKGDAASKGLWQETQVRLEKLAQYIASLRGQGVAHLGGAALT